MFKDLSSKKICLCCCVSPSCCGTIISYRPSTPRFDPLPSRQMPTQAYNASTIIQADGVIVALVKLQWLLTHGPSRASRLRLRSWLARSSWLLSYIPIAWQTLPPPHKARGLRESRIVKQEFKMIVVLIFIWFTECLS